MLDAAVLTRIREYIDAELAPRERQFLVAIRGETSRLAASGQIGGGRSFVVYANAGRDELAVRAQVVWAAIRRSHASLVRSVEATTLADLRQQLDEYISRETGNVLRLVTVGVKVDRDGKGVRYIDQEIQARSRELHAQFDIEAQFYVNELESAAARATAQGAGATLNFHGPVGAVQTGAYANAHVSMAAGDRESLREALERLASALAADSELAADRREQVQEVVADTIFAVRAERPNPHKITTLLGGIGTLVRTVASVRPAYEVLRDVAARIGIMLQ